MGDDSKKKKIAIAGVSSLILVAMVVACTVGIRNSNNGPSSNEESSPPAGEDISTSAKAVQAICQPTDYKEACQESLHNAHSTEPKELIRLAFQVAMSKLAVAANESTTLRELEKDPRANSALENCKELMEYAIDDLKASFERLGGFEVTKMDALLADLKTWLSATITYQETCLDGFQNTTGTAGEQMRKIIQTTSHLTSNALAMISELSSVLTTLHIPGVNRRLLTTDEAPSWLNQGRRNLLSAQTDKITPNVTVAKDGSGNFTTLTDVLPLIPKWSNDSFVIYMKAGVYNEHVQFNKSMTHVVLIGDGPRKTIITGNRNWIDGTPTFKTATVAALADFFTAKDIGFENTAGAIKHQAVALRVQSDKAIFYNCQMDGYQDTLYVHTKRQYYRDCTISGTIDFVFGDAAAVFQNCTFVVRKPLDNQRCIVTAQGRNESRMTTGIVIQNSRFTSAPEYFPVRMTLKSYLGRPWKEFSRTIIMESFIEDLIQPEGWLAWEGDFALKTLFYSEYKNRGPGSSKAGRVKWAGVKRLSAERVVDFTAAKFIEGDEWIPATGIPYASGLLNSYPAGGGGAVSQKPNSTITIDA